MERLKIIIIAFFCISFGIVNAKGVKTAKTPTSVAKFLDNIENLSMLSNEEEAVVLTEENRNLFSSAPTGIDMNKFNSSEFQFLGLESVKTSRAYCIKLCEYIYQKKRLKLSHQQLSTVIKYQIGANGKEEPFLYNTTIKKTCTLDNRSRDLWQIFTVSCENGLICSLWTSDRQPDASGDGAQDTKVYNTYVKQNNINQHQDTDILTEEQYLILYSQFLTAKDYDRAYETLKKLTEVYDSSIEGWYQMALLIFYKEGWSKKRFSDRRKVAVDIMENKVTSRSNVETFKNVLYTMKHRNEM